MSKENQQPTAVAGQPHPLGTTFGKNCINFAVFSRNAQSVTLVYQFPATQNSRDQQEIKLDPEKNKTGDIWHIRLLTEQQSVCYGYRIDGTSDPQNGVIFYPKKILIDPYCRALTPRAWGTLSDYGTQPSSVSSRGESFDWQGDRPLKTPLSDTVIYELHVRGFTRHPSSRVASPGTFLGVIEKIPYFKDLGITAVELMPLTEWDETDNRFYHPETNEKLLNYWGYNPLSFFALKSGFAANPDNHLNEFKEMVRRLHLEGIEVILDMVFNHSGETDLEGTTTSFRGIDNAIYYMIDQTTGEYHNFTGCGNTINCNHPVVRELIRDSLRYWVQEMHIDGFRFDLAAIFSRDKNGEVVDNSPLIELIAEDPLLRDTKIIAEAWDASGLYQVGSFSDDARWLEWNGRFRDDVRRFMAGHRETISALATRIAGSSDLYRPSNRGPLNSVNFITSHDGFTLYDLVSYEQKRNHSNGEQGRDGENHNLSWNSGHEGDPCPPEVEKLRLRRMRTFVVLQLLSQGIPMLTAGDEFGRTQQGNNNCWCQDSELSWIDWTLAEKNHDLLRFFRKCIALRKQNKVFRRSTFFEQGNVNDWEKKEILWQSLTPGNQDWSASCKTLGFILHGVEKPASHESSFFVMINGDKASEAHFTIPPVPNSRNQNWLLIINTAAKSPDDIIDVDKAQSIGPGSVLNVANMGLIVLQGGTSG